MRITARGAVISLHSGNSSAIAACGAVIPQLNGISSEIAARGAAIRFWMDFAGTRGW